MTDASSTPLRRHQQLLIGHGALVLLFGFIVGFGFVFFLLGKIALWPIPGSIDYQLPGTYDAWRMAHLEGIMNGFALWIVAAVLPFMPFAAKGIRNLTWGFILIAWFIVVASLFDPLFPDARALEYGRNALNTIAFLIFYPAIFGVVVVVCAIAWKSLRRPKS